MNEWIIQGMRRWCGRQWERALSSKANYKLVAFFLFWSSNLFVLSQSPPKRNANESSVKSQQTHRLVPFYSDVPLFQLRRSPIVQALPSSSRLWFVFLRLQFLNIHDDTMNTVKFLLLGVLLPVTGGNSNKSWYESLSNSVVSIIRAAVALAVRWRFRLELSERRIIYGKLTALRIWCHDLRRCTAFTFQLQEEEEEWNVMKWMRRSGKWRRSEAKLCSVQ